MKNLLRRFFGSLAFRLIIIISVVGIIPAVIVQTGLLKTYEKRAVNIKTIEIQSQAKILANTIVAENYIENPRDTVLDAELSLFSTIYDGRVMVVDSTYRIVKDTYDLDTRKTIISREVMQSFRGEEVTNYDSENRYIELVLPLTPQITGEEAVENLPVLGVMVVSVSTDNDAYNYEYLRSRGILVVVVIGMIAVLIAIVSSIHMLTPLRRLSSEIRRMHAEIGTEEIEPSGYTEIRELAERINAMNEQAKLLNASRQEFVSNVSHELKTPLTSMKVLADSLNGQENVPVELYQEFMQDITEEIDRENKIISDLLSLVKMDKASSDMSITPVNINELLELIMKRLQPIADGKNVDANALNRTVLVNAVEDCGPEIAADRIVRKLDMLCRVKAEAVDAAVHAFHQEIINLLLNKLVCGIEVRHAHLVLRHIRAAAVVDACRARMEVLFFVQFRIDVLIDLRPTAAAGFVRKMVGDDIDDDLDTVGLLCYPTQLGKFRFGAEP